MLDAGERLIPPIKAWKFIILQILCKSDKCSAAGSIQKQKPAEAGFYINQVKLTDKPGSVVDSHSSRPAITHWLKQPTRVQYGPYLVNPYLALLRVEFTVPRTVRGRRRSGDCLVSFGAQYRRFVRLCHPALRIPVANVTAILHKVR